MIKTAEEIFNDIFWPEKGLDTYFKMMRRLSIKAMEDYHAQFTQPQKVEIGNVFIEREIKSYGLPKKTGKYIYKDKWGSFGECVYAYPPSTINESWDSKYPVSWLEPLPQGEGYSVEEWIDVKDELPKKDGNSSIFCLVNDTSNGIVVRPFNEYNNVWDHEDGDDYYTDAIGGRITHWRTLPQPPIHSLKQKEG